jgi:hypothetical protein
MFKIIVTMKKRADLSTAEFERYYNDRHLPFLKEILPPVSGKSRVHYRNFPRLDDPFLDLFLDGRGVVSDPSFDCMTEVIYEDRESAIEYFKNFFSSGKLKSIKEDEGNFVDLDTVKFHVVECIESSRIL